MTKGVREAGPGGTGLHHRPLGGDAPKTAVIEDPRRVRPRALASAGTAEVDLLPRRGRCPRASGSARDEVHGRVAAVRLRDNEAGCADERGGDDWTEADRALDRRRGGGGRIGPHGPVYNPATGEQSGEVQFASVEEIDRAVAAAKAGVRDLAHLVAVEAGGALLPDLPAPRRAPRDLARLLTAEHGKVLSDALGEVQRGIEVIEYVCGIPELLKGDYSSRPRRGSTSTRSASPSGSSRGSPRSTSRRWCPCGCGPRRSRAGTRSS